MANYNSRVFHNRDEACIQRRQTIIPGQHQNQHIRFVDDEYPSREPRAMKRNQDDQDNGVVSKRMKIEDDIERDTAAHAHITTSDERYRGSEGRNWHQDSDHYGQQGEL